MLHRSRSARRGRIPLALTVALATLGAVAVSTQVARASTNPVDHILVPSFIYPGSGWDGIASAYPTVGIALLNVDSGPGPGPEAIFQTQIASEQSAGVAIYGYVSSAYGAESLPDVEAEISDYAIWYGVGNIFVDEAPTDCSLVSTYYQPLYTYIHAHGGDEILNPGTSTSACYMSATDILDTFEGTYAQYATYPTPSWTSGYPAKRFFNEIYSTPTEKDMTVAVAESRARGVGWVYVTNLGLPNPYDALPSYWIDEVSAVAGDLPTVTKVTPTSGPATGGTTVTITGSKLTGATKVLFGTTPAARFKIVSARRIVAHTATRAAGIVEVRVTTPRGSSVIIAAGKFTYS